MAVKDEMRVLVVVKVVVFVAKDNKKRAFPVSFGGWKPGCTTKGTEGVSRATRSNSTSSCLISGVDLYERKKKSSMKSGHSFIELKNYIITYSFFGDDGKKMLPSSPSSSWSS